MLNELKAPAWYRTAPCRGQDRLFFSAKPSKRKAAVRICVLECEHTEECLGIAVSAKLIDGVWGGKTGPEIERIVEIT